MPPELQRILGECLEKEPADQDQHADQLVVDLRKLYAGPRTRTLPRRALQVMSSPLHRKRMGWGDEGASARRRVLMGALACLLLAAGVGTWQWF